MVVLKNTENIEGVKNLIEDFLKTPGVFSDFTLNRIRDSFGGAVIISLTGIVLFIIVSLNPYFSFDFLKYFSITKLLYKTESFEIGGGEELMSIFTLSSVLLGMVISLVKFGVKKIFRVDINAIFTVRLRFILSLIIVSLIYASALLIIIYKMLDTIFYFVLSFMFIFNVVLLLMYYYFDYLIDYLIKDFLIKKFLDKTVKFIMKNPRKKLG